MPLCEYCYYVQITSSLLAKNYLLDLIEFIKVTGYTVNINT